MSSIGILGIVVFLILILDAFWIVQGIRRRRWGVVTLTGIAAIAFLALLYWGLLIRITFM